MKKGTPKMPLSRNAWGNPISRWILFEEDEILPIEKLYCISCKKDESIEKTKEKSFFQRYSKIGMKKLKLNNYF